MVLLMYEPLIFAHRGSSSVAFENTMKAFEKAYEQGADGIELDVQLSEDGVPFVIHDPDLKRVAGLSVTVNSMTSQELSKVRIGKKFARKFTSHYIPSLMEAALFCAKNNLTLNVELKETVL